MVSYMKNLSSGRVSVEDCCEFETILIYIESSKLDLQSKTLSQIQGEGILNKNP